MPTYSPDQEKQFLVDNGLDPEKYQLSDDGQFVQPRSATVQPPATSTPQSQVKLTPDKTIGAGEAAKRSFISNVLPSTASMIGGASTLALLTGAGLDMTGVGAIAGIPLTALGALGTGYAAKKLQQKFIEPETEQQKDIQAEQQHPVASTLGNLATIPLGGLNPSPTGLIRAAGAVPKLATGLALNPEEVSSLGNIAIGGAMGAVSPLAQGDFNPKDIATSVAEGALFNKPNAIGIRAGFGGGVENPLTGLKTAQEQGSPISPPAKTEGVQVAPDYNTDGRVNPDVSSTSTGLPFNSALSVTGGKGVPKNIPYLIDQSTKPSEITTMEAEGGFQKPKLPLTDILPDKSFQQQRAETVMPNSETAKFQAQDNTGTQNTLTKEAQAFVDSGNPPTILSANLRRIAKENGITEYKNPTQLFEQLKLKGQSVNTIKKFQDTSDLAGDISSKLQEKGIPTKPTDIWYSILKDFGAKFRNIATTQDGKLIGPTGKPIAGEAILRTGLKEALTKVNPETFGLDTQPHEMFHIFVDDLEKHGSPSDKLLVKNFYKIVEESPEFKAANDQRIAQGLEPQDANEFATTQVGLEFVHRQLGLGKESPLASYWKDIVAHIKTKYAHNATMEDYRRLLNYKFTNDQSFHNYFKTGVNLAVTSNPQVQSEQQDKSGITTLPSKDDRLVLVKKPDGTTYQAAYSGKFYTDHEGNKIPSIAKQMPDGKWSHGMLGKDEEIIQGRQMHQEESPLLPLGDTKTTSGFAKMKAAANGNEKITKNAETEVKKNAIDEATVTKNQEQPAIKPLVTKESTANKLGFLPFLTSRVDKIAQTLKSPTANYVTEQLHKFFGESDLLQGEIGNRLIQATRPFTQEQIEHTYKYLYDVDNKSTSTITLTPQETTLSKQIVELLREPRREQIQQGLMVKEGGSHFRAAGIKPEGYMFNMLDPKVVYTWAEHPLSPEAKHYDDLYVKHLVEKGNSPEESKQILHEYKGALGNNVAADVEFAALRKAEGAGLPWELAEKNFASAATRYGRRAANDLAYYKFIQNDPKMLKALNLRDQFGKLPSSNDNIDTENISTSKEVKDAMRSVHGVDFNNSPNISAWARAVNNTVMGIGTSARNILNMPSFIAGYVQVPQLGLVAKAITNLNDSRVKAFESNAVRPHFKDFDAAGIHEGNPNPVINLLNKYSEFMRHYQGRDFSDKFEGEYYFSLGQLLATDNIAKAKLGNKESVQFLRRFGDLVENGGVDRLLKGEVMQDDITRIAKRFVDGARGTYSAEGLPSWAIEGDIAPFTALSRFSLEKSNTIWKDVILPMKKGIYGPFLRYTLGSLGVGIAIDKLNDELSNKKGQDPKINEIVASGNYEQLFPKAIGLLQLASFAGTIGDSLKLATNLAQNKSLKYSNPLSFPLYSLITDNLIANGANAVQAIKDGEDPFETAGLLIAAITNQSFQTLRYVENRTSGAEDNKRKDEFRDLRVFNQLEGNPVQQDSGTGNPFEGQATKQFKKTGDVVEAANLLPQLIGDAMKKAGGNPEKLRQLLTSIKQNNFQTMPNPSNIPISFLSYLNFLSKTQGPQAAQQRLQEYITQNAVNKSKAAMIPTTT